MHPPHRRVRWKTSVHQLSVATTQALLLSPTLQSVHMPPCLFVCVWVNDHLNPSPLLLKLFSLHHCLSRYQISEREWLEVWLRMVTFLIASVLHLARLTLNYSSIHEPWLKLQVWVLSRRRLLTILFHSFFTRVNVVTPHSTVTHFLTGPIAIIRNRWT